MATTRIGHCADLHIRSEGALDPSSGRDRTRERLRTAWRWVCEDAVQRGVTHLVVAGDCFNTPIPEPSDLVAFLEGIRVLVTNDVHAVILLGNHDIELSTGLSSSVSPVGVIPHEYIHVISRPEVIEAGGVEFVGFPHPHRRALDLELGNIPVAQRVTAVSEKMQSVVEGFALRHPDAIATAHITTIAAALGGERYMAMGWDVSVPPEAFSGFTYAALGHIHYPQRVADNAYYAGPIERLGFGDERIAPGYYVVDIESGLNLERVPYPHATRYTTLTSGDPAAADLIRQGALAGGFIRVVGKRDPAFLDYIQREANALEVFDATKVERHESAAAPEVTSGLSPTEAMAKYIDLHPIPDKVERDEVNEAMRVLTGETQ